MIKVEHISKQFKKVKAVDDVSLEVKKGEIVCLIGPSGSGKSTVLRCIHGLEVPETGYVYLNGEVLDPKKSNYQELRNKMGFVFQHFNLFPHMTVLENLTLSLTKVRHMDEEKANEIACNYLTRVGLLDKKDEYPNKLSGGQKQRVFIAMALAQDTKVLFLDEPTTYLDIRYQLQILKLIRRLNKEFGMTIVMVFHDINQALYYSDEIAAMRDGQIAAKGKPDEIITSELINKVYGVNLDVEIHNNKPFVISWN